ncbi:hypothetical protein HELRODRAFT_162655 [Helobdella robusta]|uniref:Uncharacterized protein n=1 Tax=Helobdella robusta TaxID=6412 RepID=T1ESZ1_HELRO|nr:hypothetical protein HELRODRAFT_162655 [Helobdella robusta]ESN99162.1 hypothetical protein HELRODRAFT_162655 [Helobdella robusta]
MSSAKSLATSLLPSPQNTKVPVEQSSKPHNKHVKKCVRDLMSDSLSQSNASSIHESSDMSSITSFDDSTSEYAKGDSPSHLGSFCYPLNELRRKYKREFKDAIRKNYKYMMSENIMDSCKLTENEFSAFDSDEVSSESNAISYNEFVRQYQELITWLTNMHENINQNQVNCCNSEKYLNQAYHEELLHRLTRRTQFQEYSRQLIVHYPNKRNDILAMCNRVDQLWMELEKDVVPAKLGNPLFVIEGFIQFF